MRRLILTLGLLAATGCEDRRTFDERYDDTRKQLEERAEALDRNLAAPPQADGSAVKENSVSN